MARVLFLIGVIALGCLFIVAEKREMWRPVRCPFVGWQLLDMPDDEKYDCMSWALGPDWMTQRVVDLPDSWRTQHPDLPIITGCMSPIGVFKIISEQWKAKGKS